VAANLFKAFEEARRISVERALACTSSCCRCRGLRVREADAGVSVTT